MHWQNGSVYMGEWYNDKYNGWGSLKIGNEIKTGYYLNNNFVGVEKDERVGFKSDRTDIITKRKIHRIMFSEERKKTQRELPKLDKFIKADRLKLMITDRHPRHTHSRNLSTS